MTSKLEQVAEAVREASVCGMTLDGQRVFCDHPGLADKTNGYGQSLRFDECDCKKIARAAIGAMRDPTPEMEDDEAMAIALHEELRKQQAFSIEKHGKIALGTFPFSQIVWRHMIDATLLAEDAKTREMSSKSTD